MQIKYRLHASSMPLTEERWRRYELRYKGEAEREIRMKSRILGDNSEMKI